MSQGVECYSCLPKTAWPPTSNFHRAPGSIGCSATPSRVFKNKKMPGQLGNEKVTVQKLTVVRVDAAANLILIKGAIPGAKNAIVVLKDSVKVNL